MITTVKSLLQKLSKKLRREPQAPSISVEIDLGNLDEYVKSDPKLQDAIQRISRAIPPPTEKPVAVTPDRIQVDSAAILVTLLSSGYEPMEFLALLAKVYGALMSSAPSEIPVEGTSIVLTPNQIRDQFFAKCEDERNYLTELKSKLAAPTAENGKGMLH